MTQAVILAGGMGTRLGPLSQGRPKVMIEVGGRPFLEWQIRQLAAQGFCDVLLLVGYQAAQIRKHFGDGRAWGLGIRYSDEPKPSGTGSAIRLAKSQLASRFLLLYGDLYRPYNYRAFCEAQSGPCLAIYPYTLGLHTIACGNIDVDARTGLVRAYQKGKKEAWLPYVDAGFGIFPREVTELLPPWPCSFEEVVYPSLATAEQLRYVLLDRNFYDIGNPDDLARTQRLFSQAGGPCESL